MKDNAEYPCMVLLHGEPEGIRAVAHLTVLIAPASVADNTLAGEIETHAFRGKVYNGYKYRREINPTYNRFIIISENYVIFPINLSQRIIITNNILHIPVIAKEKNRSNSDYQCVVSVCATFLHGVLVVGYGIDPKEGDY